ncbi:hypothetical protein [Flavobacterium crassostreae]|uniref:Lipoprotein n=1 Tax=Flavobacterium crassostreae TaxID=1763534 RepID=A0A1B9E9L7_9FLAO|nr:hypothetical protein [Flavobacterium crassostreae]OCB78632.1 hypothetical protein LPBF_01135 [Flavobacterium crassostreae]
MKYSILIAVLFLFSCNNKETILLPKANVSVVADVQDHSPIYLFFRTKNQDTLTEVNRKNSIITTNWILNIDKRLPLRVVIPEVIKLQEKKRKEKAHKNEKAENYYAYADSIAKNMAFFPFTKVYYKMQKPAQDGLVIYFKKNSDSVSIANTTLKVNQVVDYIHQKNGVLAPKVVLAFDKNMCFEQYIQHKIAVRALTESKNVVWSEYVF